MIDFVAGRVEHATATTVVISLGGLGVRLLVTPEAAGKCHIGDEVRLHTSFVVREDGWTLYGFADEAQRDAFELVQSVSGVGPKLALATVSTLPPDVLQSAIQTDDVATLCRVPGIGKKSAARLILELRDRLGPIGSSPLQQSHTWREQVASGLIGLGWSEREAAKACDAIADHAEGDDAASVAELLKLALTQLRRG
ncbi:MAG: Holliday junction branch migration protein RuvA [Propionibacteriales bacterium]|nr:MAG: Holliday junction branch migration protein RuvA [Propionibacteriales bacterium]